MGSVGARTTIVSPQPLPTPPSNNNNGNDPQDVDSWRAMNAVDAGNYAQTTYYDFMNQGTSAIDQQGMNSGSNLLQAVVDRLGLHDKPVVLSDADYDNQWKANALNGVELYRGVGYNSTDAYQQQFLYGDKTFISDGVHGEGIYFATSSNYAASYAGKPEINTVTGFIDKSKANVISETALKRMWANESSAVKRNFATHNGWSPAHAGAYALYKGYNVVHVVGGNGGASMAHGLGKQSQGYGDFYMPLTRGVMVMREHTRLRTR